MKRLAFFASLLLAAPVQAQTDAVMLARTCVSERGWRTETDDCAAIGAVVLGRVARLGGTVRQSIRALSSVLHHPVPEEHPIDRPWLRHLHADARYPRGLHATWTEPRRGGLPSRRDAWLATLREAEGILDGSVPSPCAEVPVSWGSDRDLALGQMRGGRWHHVACGAVANHFGWWL